MANYKFVVVGVLSGHHDYEADPNDMTEEDRVAQSGKPRLGDVTSIQIIIKESADFKVWIMVTHDSRLK